MTHDETLYSFRMTRLGSLEIAKWQGHKRPVDIYRITNKGRGFCDCIGSSRNPYCKHKQMLEKASKLGPLMGAFYNFDRDILYLPEDNEGIPLTGAVDIRELTNV